MMFALRANDAAFGNDAASLMMCPAGHRGANIASLARDASGFISAKAEASSGAKRRLRFFFDPLLTHTGIRSGNDPLDAIDDCLTHVWFVLAS